MPGPSDARRFEVETNIRAVLICLKGDVTMHQFLKEYRSIEEENLPFKEFNFASPYEFLLSLSNVVRIVHKCGEIIIQAVDTEKSKHVSDLVAGQKKSKKCAKPRFRNNFGFNGRYQNYSHFHRPRAPYYSTPNRHYSPISGPYRRPNMWNNNNAYQNQPSASTNGYHNSQGSSTEEKVTRVIITGDDSEPFNKVESEDDFEFSRPSTPSQRVEKPSIKPIARYLNETIKMHLKDKTSNSRTDVSNNYPKENNIYKETYSDESQRCHNDSRRYFDENRRNNDSRHYNETSRSNSESRGNNSESRVNNSESRVNNSESRGSNSEFRRNNNESGGNNNESQRFNYTSGIYNHESERNNHHHTENFGYVSPKNPNQNHVDESKRFDHESHNSLENASYVSPKNLQETNHYKDFSRDYISSGDEDLFENCDTSNSDVINIKIKQRLQEILRNNPDGVWSEDLPIKYFEMCKVPLYLEEWGFSSVEDFAHQLPSIFNTSKVEGRFKLYEAKNPFSGSKCPLNDQYEFQYEPRDLENCDEGKSVNDDSEVYNDVSKTYNEDSKTYNDSKVYKDDSKVYNDLKPPSIDDDDNYFYTDDEETYENCDTTKGDLINVRVKERLKILLQNNPNGIWCADLPQKYLEMSSVPLDFIEMGYNSVREFASQLPDIFHCVKSKGGGDYKLYNAQKPLPTGDGSSQHPKLSSAEQYRVYDDEPEAFPSRLDFDTIRKLYPEGVMEIGERVGHISVTELCQNRDYEEVTLCEVFTPSFFWVQLRNKDKLLKKFMQDMHIFYEEEKTRFQIAPIALEKGLNVACVYGRQWHRGLIISVLPDTQCLIHFYDYGTVKLYSPREIYFLHRRFSNLPSQAIACGLFNVRPYRANKWDKHITWKFIEKTSMPLIATVVEKNIEDNSMLVSLTDTQFEEDFHVADWMIEENFAEPGKMIQKLNFYDLLSVVLTLNDLYPEKLESILLPNTIDIKNLANYEESRLPKFTQLDYDDPSSDNSGKKQSRPPPGFSLLSTISEESPNKSETSVNSVDDGAKIRREKEYMMIAEQNNFLKEQINSLSRVFQEWPLSKFTNVNLQNPSLFHVDNSQKKSSPIFPANSASTNSNQNSYSGNSPLNGGKFPFDFTSDVREFFKSIPKLSEKINNCTNLGSPEAADNRKSPKQQENSRYQESPNFLERPKYEENFSCQDNVKLQENSNHLETPINGVPEKTQFKETNPFKDFLETSKPQRLNLKSFMNDPFPFANPNVQEEPKTDYFKNSNESCMTNPNVFVFGGGKEEEETKFSFIEKDKTNGNLSNEGKTNFNFVNGEKTNSSFVNEGEMSSSFAKEDKTNSGFVKEKTITNVSHNFAPVTDSCSEKTNQEGSKVFYESGPVMYNKSETEKNNASSILDSSIWKKIPAAEPVGTIKPTEKTGFSFTMNKPKTPAARAKERVDRHIASCKSPEKSPIVENSGKDFTPTSSFNLPSSQDISPSDSMQKNSELEIPSPKSNTSNHCSPPNEIFKTLENKSEKKVDEAFCQLPNSGVSFNDIHTNTSEDTAFANTQTNNASELFVDEVRKGIEQLNINDAKTSNQLQFTPENSPTSSTKNINLFVNNVPVLSPQKNEVNELFLETSNRENTVNSTKIETQVQPPVVQNKFICLSYELESKDRSVMVLNLNNDGWLITDEFVEAFTRLNSSSVLLKLLDMMNLVIPFQKVDRMTHPALLAELDLSPLNVPRNSKNMIMQPVHLTPLKCIVRILSKLKIISREALNSALKNKDKKIDNDNFILSDVMKLISSYGNCIRKASSKM